jgi:biotin transport system substrate-specific component
MSRMHTTEGTSIERILGGEFASGRPLVLGLGIVAFILGTAAGAYVAIPLPFTPVPVTLQPLFVILAGALLGPWAGATAMAGYLALGMGGAPVFSAGHAGLPWLLGPTGGYLIAYPAAAFVVGVLVGESRAALRVGLGLAAGVAVIYLGGLSQLWILTRQDFSTLLLQGALPFLAGDLLKVLVALALVQSLRRTRPGPS